MNKLKKALGWGKREGIIAALFSAVFAAVYVLGRHIVYTGGVEGYPTENYMTAPSAADALWLLAAFVLCFAAMALLSILIDRLKTPEGSGRKNKRLLIFVFVLLLLAWTPYLLSFYPGSIQGDSFSSIRQIIEVGHPNNNHHPVAYTLFLGIFLKIGELFSDYNIGICCYSVVQSVLMALVICRAVSFLQENGAHRIYMAATIVFYALEPLFAAYAISLWKDPLYSALLFLLSIQLYTTLRRGSVDRRGFIRMLLTALGAAFFRNNGIYVVIVSAAALGIALKNQRKIVVSAFAGIIAFYFIITSVGYKAWGIKQEFVESVGIPIQQMGAVIYYDGNMSEADEEYAYRLMLQWWWKENYAPCIVDSIKWNYFFDEDFLEQTKTEFIKTWVSMGIKNPVTYMRAYLMETHGFWKLGAKDGNGYIQFIPEIANGVNCHGIRMRDVFGQIFGFSIEEPLKNLKATISSGTLLWVTAALMLMCIIKRRRGAWTPHVRRVHEHQIVAAPDLGQQGREACAAEQRRRVARHRSGGQQIHTGRDGAHEAVLGAAEPGGCVGQPLPGCGAEIAVLRGGVQVGIHHQHPFAGLGGQDGQIAAQRRPAASGGGRREGDDVRARAADGKGQLLLQPAIVLHQLPRAARRVRLRAHASAPPFVSAAGT